MANATTFNPHIDIQKLAYKYLMGEDKALSDDKAFIDVRKKDFP